MLITSGASRRSFGSAARPVVRHPIECSDVPVMLTRIGGLALGAALLSTACSRSDPSSASKTPEKPTETPVSQPSSLPEGHSTSTTAVGLESLFVPPADLPEVVATVDKEPIRRDDLLQELRQMQIIYRATGLPDGTTRTDILRGALDRCIEYIVRYHLAKRLEVEVDEEAVTAWIADVEHRMKEDPAFAAFLTRAGKDAEQRALDGRRQVMLEGITRVVREEVEKELEERARGYYDRHPNDYLRRAGVELWRIYVKAPRGMIQRDRDIARARAGEVHEKAKASPETFDSLARTYSDGGKGPTGGYLGYVSEGSLPPELYARAQAAEPGDILSLWEDASGFTIYKVGQTREASVVSFEEAAPRIIEQIYGPFLRKRVDERIAELRDELDVKIHIPGLEKVAAQSE